MSPNVSEIAKQKLKGLDPHSKKYKGIVDCTAICIEEASRCERFHPSSECDLDGCIKNCF